MSATHTPAAIVFDMDGVLADTERLKFHAHRRAVEAAGGRLDPDGYRQQMGKAHLGVIRAFLSASGLDTGTAAVERYERRFQSAYRELLSRDLRPMPGARDLLAACHAGGRRLGLVTSSEKWMVDVVLRALVRRDCATVPGIRHGLGRHDRFEAIVTAGDVEHEKPHPEPYLRARRTLTGVPVVAVEDTSAGVASATAAGLPVIAVRHDFNRDEPFEGAAAVVDSLDPARAFLAQADRVAAASTPPTP